MNSNKRINSVSQANTILGVTQIDTPVDIGNKYLVK